MKSLLGVSLSVASVYGNINPFDVGATQQQRQLQPPMLPNYTSPPTPFALKATPVDYRDDAVIEAGRQADANGTCMEDVSVCQIPFVPQVDSPRLGVVFYGGALVDPRGYSPIAKDLAARYGIAVALQIFDSDLALPYGRCKTERLELAQQLFPSVEKWALAGHSYGGIAAIVDIWTAQNDTDTKIGGLALLASYIRQDLGCGAIDFSTTAIPMASVNASNDVTVNSTLFQMGQAFLSANDTFHMEILGGNHGGFGSYDDSERFEQLNQTDGNATIPKAVQLDLSTAAIAHVVSRMGIPLPELKGGESSMTSGCGHIFSFRGLVVVATSLIVSVVTSF